MSTLSQIKSSHHFKRGSFFSNVLTLMTGTTIAQAVPIALSPILTRMYGPEEFGVFALFISLTAILGSIANARYELAIMLPEADEDALNIAALGILIAAILSVVLLLIVCLFNFKIAQLLGNEKIAPWLYLVPITVFLTGLFQSMRYLHMRLKDFVTISRVTVYKSLMGGVAQIALGWIGLGTGGLVGGNFLSYIVGNIKFLSNFYAEKKKKGIKISLVAMKRMGKRYSNFPKFSVWATLANSLAFHMITFFISSLFGIITLGHYALVNRTLAFPSSLIGTAIGDVFFKKINETRIAKGRTDLIFLKALMALFAFSILGFGPLYFIIEWLFSFVFGERWAIAGQYAKIMMPLFAVRFCVSPLTTVCSTFEKQKLALLWQIGIFLATILVFSVSKWLNLTATAYMEFYTLVLATYYLLSTILFYKISKPG